MPNRSRVAVVGGGISGLTAALNLAERGVDVALVERTPVLGGNANTVCCKAVDGKCQLCGGCLLSDRVDAVRALDRIRILTDTAVDRVKRANGSFSLRVAAPHGDAHVDADAVILATGFDHVDAHTKGPYSYGILPSVTTGEEMERRVKEEGQGAFDGVLGGPDRRLAFIQCVGSRDEHDGRGYCSQVCCRYACRLARLFKSRNPELDVTIFKMDIQSSGRDMQSTYESLPGEGIRIVSGLPAVIRRSTADPQRATFVYDDVVAGTIAQEDFDLIVLSVGVQPRDDALEMADLFAINQDAYGFFQTRDDDTSTIAPGVFLAGCCQAPRSMSESVAHAQVAAQACYLYLQEAHLHD